MGSRLGFTESVGGQKSMLVFGKAAKKGARRAARQPATAHDVGREPPRVCRRSAAAQETASHGPLRKNAHQGQQQPPALPPESGPGPSLTATAAAAPPRRRSSRRRGHRAPRLHDDSPGRLAPATPEQPSDPPRLMDAIAAYNKLMDAEEALVEVVGLDGLRRHRRRRDVVDEDRACDKPCWGLDDFEDDYPPACADSCPIA